MRKWSRQIKVYFGIFMLMVLYFLLAIRLVVQTGWLYFSIAEHEVTYILIRMSFCRQGVVENNWGFCMKLCFLSVKLHKFILLFKYYIISYRMKYRDMIKWMYSEEEDYDGSSILYSVTGFYYFDFIYCSLRMGL